MGATFEKIMKIGRKKCFRRWWVKQKMAILIINNATFNAHTEPLFKKLNILPLSKLIDYFKGTVQRDF